MKNIRLIIGISVSLLVTACSPSAKVTYKFLPVTSKNEQVCIDRCLEKKVTCISLKHEDFRQCVYLSKMEADACNLRAFATYSPCGGFGSGWWGYGGPCMGRPCYGATELCEDEYMECYQTCGGKVEKSIETEAN